MNKSYLITLMILLPLAFNAWFFLGFSKVLCFVSALLGGLLMIFTHNLGIIPIVKYFPRSSSDESSQVLFKMYFISILEGMFLIVGAATPVVVYKLMNYYLIISISSILFMSAMFFIVLNQTKRFRKQLS